MGTRVPSQTKLEARAHAWPSQACKRLSISVQSPLVRAEERLLKPMVAARPGTALLARGHCRVSFCFVLNMTLCTSCAGYLVEPFHLGLVLRPCATSGIRHSHAPLPRVVYGRVSKRFFADVRVSSGHTWYKRTRQLFLSGRLVDRLRVCVRVRVRAFSIVR